MSESSLQDVEEIQKALTPDEFEKLMESKRIEEKRFVLGIDSHMDAYREVADLPTFESQNVTVREDCRSDSKSYGMKMIPANCEDGVDLTDDQSCVNSERLSKIVMQKTEELISKLMMIDPPTEDTQDSNHYPSQQSNDGRSVNGLQVRSRKARKALPDSPSVTESKPPSEVGLFESKHIWSVIRSHENEVQTSSLSESEIETSDNIAKDTNGNGVSGEDSQGETAITPGDNSNRKKAELAREKYEKECLKQQHKDRGDSNSFQTVNSTLQLLKDLGVGEAIRTKWQSKTANAEALPPSDDEVLVCGDNRPKCVYSVGELNVPDEMRCSLRNNVTNALITKPTPLQSFVWPAVLRGRHVVGIDSSNSGKKLAYLLPVLKQIVDSQSLYKTLPKGHGVGIRYFI